MLPTISISEKQWLEVKLELFALRWSLNVSGESMFFTMSDRNTVIINISSSLADSYLTRGIAKNEQLNTYFQWFRSIQHSISEILSHLPSMNSTFDITKDLQVRIYAPYGMGSMAVGNFSNGGFSWDDERA